MTTQWGWFPNSIKVLSNTVLIKNIKYSAFLYFPIRSKYFKYFEFYAFTLKIVLGTMLWRNKCCDKNVLFLVSKIKQQIPCHVDFKTYEKYQLIEVIDYTSQFLIYIVKLKKLNINSSKIEGVWYCFHAFSIWRTRYSDAPVLQYKCLSSPQSHISRF